MLAIIILLFLLSFAFFSTETNYKILQLTGVYSIFIAISIFISNITKLYIENAVINDMILLIKKNGKMYDGKLIKTIKKINWFGSNFYIFKYIAVVECEKGVYETGYFLKDPIKYKENSIFKVYILNDYVYIEVK